MNLLSLFINAEQQPRKRKRTLMSKRREERGENGKM